MENTELQSTFELIDNLEFEEKVDFENLVLSSESTDIPNLETIDIKEEPLQQRQQHQQHQQLQQHQQPKKQHHRGNAGCLHNGSNNPSGVGGNVGSCCSAKNLAHSRGELTSFGTSLLRPEAAAHKVHNSSRKPKHVVIDEIWRHYKQCHAHEIMWESQI